MLKKSSYKMLAQREVIAFTAEKLSEAGKDRAVLYLGRGHHPYIEISKGGNPGTWQYAIENMGEECKGIRESKGALFGTTKEVIIKRKTKTDKDLGIIIQHMIKESKKHARELAEKYGLELEIYGG